MKTTITLFRKATFLCLFALLVLSNRLHAQIVYTDIPDATPNATYSLDLNNDSIEDFSIHFAMPNKIICSPKNNNAYSGNLIGGVHLPWAVSSSVYICDTLSTWYNGSNPGIMAQDSSMGYWVGQANKYLALKLFVGANTYYGWARIDVLQQSGSFTIKDYAYQSTPNACILAGQIKVGIKEIDNKNDFIVFPNPFSFYATIQAKNHFKNATLTICNSMGKTVKQINNIEGQTISLTRDDLPSGLYFIRIAEENKIIGFEKFIMID